MSSTYQPAPETVKQQAQRRASDPDACCTWHEIDLSSAWRRRRNRKIIMANKRR